MARVVVWLIATTVALAAISRVVYRLRKEIQRMTKQMQNLVDNVTILKGQVASTIALVNGLTALFLEAKDDPAAIQAVADDVKAQTDALVAAALANPLPETPTP